MTPLHEAAKHSHDFLVSMLIDAKANVNARDNRGKSPLHHASLLRNLDIIKTLVEHEAEVDAKDSLGIKPIQEAARKGYGEIVDYLKNYKHRN